MTAIFQLEEIKFDFSWRLVYEQLGFERTLHPLELIEN
jgi:hypothetical protein